MEILMEKKTAAPVLDVVKGLIPASPKLDVLKCVMIRAKDGEARVLAENLQESISIELPCEIMEDGEVCIPGELLHSVVSRSRGDEPLHLKAKKTCVIRSGGSTSRMAVVPSEMFPEPFEGDEKRWKSWFSCPSMSLLIALRDGGFIASGKAGFSAQYGVMAGAGVHISTNLSTPCVVSTDNRRLSHSEVLEAHVSDSFAYTVPAASAKIALGIVERCSEEIVFDVTDGAVRMRAGGATMYMRTLACNFPAYQNILSGVDPNEYVECSLLRGDMEASLRRVSPFAGNGLVRIRNASEGLILSAQSPDTGQMEDFVPAEKGCSDEFDVSVNAKFLLESLQHMRLDGPVSLPKGKGPLGVLVFTEERGKSFLMPCNVEHADERNRWEE